MRPNYFRQMLETIALGICIILIMVYTLSMIETRKQLKAKYPDILTGPVSSPYMV